MSTNYKDQYGFYKNILIDNGAIVTSQNATQHAEMMTALGQINATSFFVEVNEGLVSGTTSFDKFGRNPDIDAASAPEDIWNGGGLYTGFPDTAEPLEIYSSNVNDTVGGTGARTVEISNLLDGNFNAMPPVIVNMNGQLPVSLGTQIYSRCTRVRVLTAGVSGSNAGTLTVRHSSTVTNRFALVPPTYNQSQIFAFTVPMGKTLYVPTFSIRMTRINGSSGSANVTVKIKNGDSNVWNVVRNVDISDSQAYKYDADTYFVITEGQDAKATIESVSDNNTTVTGEADGFFVDND